MALGEYLSTGWRHIAEKHGIAIHIDGIPPLPHLEFLCADPLAVQTLYTQEMLKKGYLLGASVYMTYAYSEMIIDGFINASDAVFGEIKAALDAENVRSRLDNAVIQPGFVRLA